MMIISLQKVCGDQVPVAIANHPDVKGHLFCSSTSSLLESSSKFGEWKVTLENIVSKIIEKLPPRLMESVTMSIVPFVALHMLKWAEFNKSYFDLSLEFSLNFINCSFFTFKGTIDEEKVAKVLVENHNLETIVQYKIACYYFMEETIIILWNRLREESNFREQIKKHDFGEPFVMWSEYLEERETLSNPLELMHFQYSFLTKAFRYGLANKNVAAVKYFWSNEIVSTNLFEELPEGDDESLNRGNYESWPSVFFKDCELSPLELVLSKDFEGHRNILVFFLSKLNLMELNKFLRVQKLTNIFKYLLHWPYQNFVNEKLESHVQDLKNCDHVHIVRNIVEMTKDPHLRHIFDYRNLLKKYLINRVIDPRNHLFVVESSRSSNCSFIPSVPILDNLLAIGSFTPEDDQTIGLISEFEYLNLREMYFIVKRSDNSFIMSLKDLQLDGDFLSTQTVWQVPVEEH